MPPRAESRPPWVEEQALVALLRQGLLPPLPGLDAERLRAKAAWHGLSGLAWRAARAAGAAELARALEPDYRRVQAGNLLLMSRLQGLSALLHQAGVEAAALKGAALLSLVYERASDRPLSDVDLLVREADWPRLRQALAASGDYRLPGAEKEARRLRYHRKLEVETVEAPSCVFEIHTDLEIAGRRSLDTEACLQRAVPMPGAWHGLKRLADADLAFHLVVHAARHFSAPRLIWMQDLHLLDRRGMVDWEQMARQAGHTGSRVAVWFALLYLERVHPGTVPEPVLRRLQPGMLQRRVLDSVGTDNPALPTRDLWSAPLRWSFALALLDSPWAMARFLATHGYRRFVLGLTAD